MEISLQDFNALSAEQSQREVRIAKLEMELQTIQDKHAQEIAALHKERDELWSENNRLREQVVMLETDFENVRFENHWMRQYILLSVDRVRIFFSRMRNIEVLSAVKSFVLNVLPENASAEQIAYANRVMQLPMKEEPPRVVNVAGNYNDIHDNGSVVK